jgi:sulfide:quinone oxidoreductase
MKRLLILGAGTGGTLLANRLVRRLPEGWKTTVVDPDEQHLYQPGLLFLPFGAHDEEEMRRPRHDTLSNEVEWVVAGVDRVDPTTRTVTLEGGQTLTYDLLVIASGSRVRPDLTEGLLDPVGWNKTIFDFYTLEGAQALRSALEAFPGGRLVINIVEMPIKCPVAPLEFAFLADAFFEAKGIRDRVEIIYATPLEGAFTKPIAAEKLGYLLAEKKIVVESEFATGSVDAAKRILRSYDDREIPYDLLVTVPTHSGAAFIEKSGLGDELGFVPTDRHTLAAKGLENVFVLGDATDLPSSKAGSVAHFQGEGLVENILRQIEGKPLLPEFDGHANCFVETGHGKAMLIDFNYDTEPLPGDYPIPHIGPLSLLSESHVNHWGKLGFRWIYWNGLLPGRPLPIASRMSMAGKDVAPPHAAPRDEP